MIVWDERKRQTNLVKHGLDFADAYLVYASPHKVTLPTPRGTEMRELDVAVVEVFGSVLALVYVRREADVRVISFRPASRRERRRYERAVTEK